MINRNILLGIFFSIFTLTLCPASYAENSQAAQLTNTQQTTNLNASQSLSLDQEMMEKARLAREADREREAQQRQQAQIARQKQIDEIIQHRHDVTPQSFNTSNNTSESDEPTRQINHPTISTTQNQTNNTTSTLPKFFVLLVLIALATFWLKIYRKAPKSTTNRNKTKTTSIHQNTSHKQTQNQQQSFTNQPESQPQTSKAQQQPLPQTNVQKRPEPDLQNDKMAELPNGVYLYIENDLVSFDDNIETFVEGIYELGVIPGITEDAESIFKSFLNDFYTKIDEFKDTNKSSIIDFYNMIRTTPFELEGGRYFLELPHTHRIQVLKFAIETAKKHQILIMSEETGTFFFFPSGRVEPDISWQDFVLDTWVENKPFPRTVPQFEKDIEPDLSKLLADHAFVKCTLPFFDGEKGYVKEVAFGKIYAGASIDKSKWGGFRFNLYFYLVNDLAVSIYNHIYTANRFDFYSCSISLSDFGRDLIIENFSEKKAALKKINQVLLVELIDHIETLSDLDQLMNGFTNIKIRDGAKKARALIVAKLANNPNFENLALKWELLETNAHNDKPLERTRLIQYLRDNYSESPTIENSLENPLAQTQKNARTELCRLSCDTLYIWNPKHFKVESENDIAARQCVLMLLQQQLSPSTTDSILSFVQKVVQRFRQYYANYPELITLYENLVNDFKQHTDILAQIPLPKTNRLVARHEIVRLATENGLVVYDGQSSVVFFPDKLSFKQRMLMFADKLKKFYESKNEKSYAGRTHLYDIVIHQFPLLAEDAFAVYLPEEYWSTMISILQTYAQECGLTLYEQGPLFLKTGHIFPREKHLIHSQEALWRASLTYLDAKQRNNLRPFTSHLLPIEPLFDDLMAKYDFKKSVLPLLFDIIGYFHRTQNCTQYLASNIFYFDNAAFLNVSTYILVNSIETIYKKFTFAPLASMFSFSIPIKMRNNSDPINYQDLDNILNETETKVLSLVIKLRSITELDAAFNGDNYPELKASLKNETMPFRLILARLANNPNFENLVSEFEGIEASEWGANHKAKETEFPKLVEYLRQENLIMN